jgi:hypothetical protein
MASLESSHRFSVIASECEVTQLVVKNWVQRLGGALENSVSWVSSLMARNDDWLLLARTNFVNACIIPPL